MKKLSKNFCSWQDIASADSAANELGLTPEEKSFYDALTKPQAIHDFYSNEELVAMTKELTDSLRKNRTIAGRRKNQLVQVCAE